MLSDMEARRGVAGHSNELTGVADSFLAKPLVRQSIYRSLLLACITPSPPHTPLLQIYYLAPID